MSLQTISELACDCVGDRHARFLRFQASERLFRCHSKLGRILDRIFGERLLAGLNGLRGRDYGWKEQKERKYPPHRQAPIPFPC